MSFDFSRVWTRQPSIELCADQCGAKCCKGPMEIRLSANEARALGLDDMGRKVTMRLRAGEKCRYLKNNLCSIYDHRPQACRQFPSRPYDFCAVWGV